MIEKVTPIIRSMGYQLIPYDNKYRLQKNNLFIDVGLNALDSINVYELVITLPHSLQMDEARLSHVLRQSIKDNLYIKTYEEKGLVSSLCTRNYFSFTICANSESFKQTAQCLEWAYKQFKITIESIDP